MKPKYRMKIVKHGSRSGPNGRWLVTIYRARGKRKGQTVMEFTDRRFDRALLYGLHELAYVHSENHKAVA